MKYCGILAVLLLTLGCDDAAEPSLAETCVEADLIAQCPAASNPILGARSVQACQSAVGGIVADGMGAATGQCHGVGGCRVYCQFSVPCLCGVAEISVDGVLCASCEGAAACGNGLCEGGEDPMGCPSDCGAACVPDERRCADEALEICNQRGRWDRLACPDREVCEIGESGADCVRMIDIVTGDMGIDNGIDGGVIDDSRIIPGRASWPEVPDVRVDAFDVPTTIHLDHPFAGVVRLWTAAAGDQVVGYGREGWQRSDGTSAQYPGGLLAPDAQTTQRGGFMVGARANRTQLGAFGLRSLQVEALGPVGEYELAGRRTGPFRVPSNAAVSISPDGSAIGWIGVQENDSVIVLWDRDQGLRDLLFPRSGPQVLALALANSGRVIATHLYGNLEPALEKTISVWDTQTETRILSIRPRNPETDIAMRMLFSPSGNELAVLYLVRNGAPFIEIWDVASAERRHTLALPPQTDVTDGPIWDWAADGRLLAMHVLVREPSGIPSSGVVSVFDTQTGQRIISHDQFGPADSVSFSTDGRLTVATSRPNRVVLYGPARE